MSLMQKYMNQLGDPHDLKPTAIVSFNGLDYLLRTLIGKSDKIKDLRVGACSHQAIIEREHDAKGIDPETVCRKCGINLDCVAPRCNDYLVLRNPLCRGPICGDCFRKGGDVFYQAFRRGVDQLPRVNDFLVRL